MSPLGIEERHVPSDQCTRLRDAVVGLQVDLLILQTAPQPFDEDIVDPPALAVHADADAVSLKHRGECLAGELTALIGIEDLRPPVGGQGLLQRFDAKIGIQHIRQLP